MLRRHMTLAAVCALGASPALALPSFAVDEKADAEIAVTALDQNVAEEISSLVQLDAGDTDVVTVRVVNDTDADANLTWGYDSVVSGGESGLIDRSTIQMAGVGDDAEYTFERAFEDSDDGDLPSPSDEVFLAAGAEETFTVTIRVPENAATGTETTTPTPVSLPQPRVVVFANLADLPEPTPSETATPKEETPEPTTTPSAPIVTATPTAEPTSEEPTKAAEDEKVVEAEADTTSASVRSASVARKAPAAAPKTQTDAVENQAELSTVTPTSAATGDSPGDDAVSSASGDSGSSASGDSGFVAPDENSAPSNPVTIATPDDDSASTSKTTVAATPEATTTTDGFVVSGTIDSGSLQVAGYSTESKVAAGVTMILGGILVAFLTRLKRVSPVVARGRHQ